MHAPVFEVAALCEIGLVVVNHLGILKAGLLPLGGGDIQQIGILFAIAFIVERAMVLRRND